MRRSFVVEENRCFQQALSNFTSEIAYAGAVRHLYHLGYSAEEIGKRLACPVSQEKIQKVIDSEIAANGNAAADSIFVQETDMLGRKSFRKVTKEEAG